MQKEFVLKVKHRADKALVARSLFDDLGFEWRVASQPCRWETLHIQRSEFQRMLNQTYRVLTCGVDLYQTAGWRIYSPLSVHGLFIDFAQTETTEQGILTFANRYGLLLGAEEAFQLGSDRAPVLCDGKDIWIDSIRQVSRAVRLWNWS